MKRLVSPMLIFLIVVSTISALTFNARSTLAASELWRVPVLNNQMIDGKDTGDVNGDGIADVSILTYGGTLQIIKNDGNEIWSKSTGFAGGSPAISDVDGDGKGEVFAFGRLGSNGAISCYDDDGTEMWSFTSYLTGIFGYAAFLDLDLDPQLEVFVTATAGYGSASTSYALDTDGSFMWSYSTPELGNQMIYTDVTGDSIPEIILATFQNVYVLDRYGSLIFPYTPDSEMHNAYVAAGDITGDGIDDLALSRIDHFNTLYAVRNDGTELWSKSYGRDSSYNLSPPIVIDVDDDGAKEVIVYGGGAIHTYDGDGTELWTWGSSTFLPSYCWPGHFDVNRDLEEEIVFDKDGRVYALSLDGHLVMDFALPNNGAFILTGTGGHVKGRETPRWGEAADVNNDSFDELIIQEIIDGQYYVAAVLPPVKPSVSTLFAFPKLSGVELAWNDPAEGLPIQSFRIYRGLSSGGETFLASVDGGTHRYIDSSVSTSLYFYYVTALNSVGESPPSNEVKCSSKESVLGLETVINLEKAITRKTLLKPLSVFTIQQNFHIAVGGSVTHRYIVQNAFMVWPITSSYSLIVGAFEIYEVNIGSGVEPRPLVRYWQSWGGLRQLRLPDVLILRSTILDAQLVLENDCKNYAFPVPSNSYIITENPDPEIVIVGGPSVSRSFPNTAIFEAPTKGHAETYAKIGNEGNVWLIGKNIVANSLTTTIAAERSKNLQWSSTGDFWYVEGTTDKGLLFSPDYDSPIASPS